MNDSKTLSPAQIKRKIDQLAKKGTTHAKLVKHLKILKKEILSLKHELNNAFRIAPIKSETKEGGQTK